MAFSETQVITRTANADCTDDESDSLQTSEASVIPQRLSKETTDPSQEWTHEKDDLLHHLRSTAGLPWAKTSLYFPHYSLLRVWQPRSNNRRTFTCSSERGAVRGSASIIRVEPNNADRAKPEPTGPSHLLHARMIGTPLPLPLIPQLTVPYSVSSSSNGPSVAKGRGRKRKVSATSELEVKRVIEHTNVDCRSDRGIVDVGGKQHYRVRCEEILEPVENLQGCANIAIAEYHLRHLL
ncbi:hypothetical protein LTR12_012405 [Friedmanniomyces endolithicus]|nr:hypothetical protein LTR12_012405 [Friedmanniomyces endolithicus]